MLEEVIKKYSDLVTQSVKNAHDAHDTLKRNLISEWFDFEEPDVRDEVKAFVERLLKPTKGFELRVFDDYGHVSLSEVVHRGVHRIRPANDKGEELRDVIIWLLTLEYAKRSNRQTAFITADNHFKGGDGEFHPDLVDDAKKSKANIVHYHSISKFIAANSLASEPTSEAEMAAFVSQVELARLMIARLLGRRLPEGTVENLEIWPRNFVSGQKYRVAEDSFYVEANYTTTVRALIQQTVFNQSFTSVFSPGQELSLPHFGPLASPLHLVPGSPGPALAPAQGYFSNIGPLSPAFSGSPASGQGHLSFINSTYEYPVEVRISVRIVSGKPESLELDQLVLQKGKLVADSAAQEGKQPAK